MYLLVVHDLPDFVRRVAGRRPAADNRAGPLFMEHLLATNEVFLALADEEWMWSRLPFEWLGSHRAGLPFRGWDRGEDGTSRKRNRELRADAIITPRAADLPRVFLELDRSTERITERVGQQSIESKLKTYRMYIALPAPGERRSWYAAAFGEGRPALAPPRRGTAPASRRLRRPPPLPPARA